MAESPVFYQKLMTAQSVIETAVVVGPGRVSRVREIALYVVFGAGTTAGAVVLEAAPDAAYTGTWANLATVSWSAATKVGLAQASGVHLAVRARISTGIVGGTVDVHLVGN
jgi:hypothetical protein